jgi:hypothetical protein
MMSETLRNLVDAALADHAESPSVNALADFLAARANEHRPTTKDGGQAFPVPAGNWSGGESWSSDNGMTLRDYFAGQAIAGSIARVAGPEWEKAAGVVATHAYLIADAMLAARAKAEK